MSREEHLAVALHQWRMTEMQYSPTDSSIVPSDLNLKQLCCGQLCDVWRYIIDNVFSSSHVYNVRGNLSLHDSANRMTEEEKQLQQDLETTEKMIHSVDAEISSLETGLANLQQDLATGDRSLLQLSHKCRQEQRRSSMYGVSTAAALRNTHSERLSGIQLQSLLAAVLPQSADSSALCQPSSRKQPTDVASCMTDMKSIVEMLCGGLRRTELMSASDISSSAMAASASRVEAANENADTLISRIVDSSVWRVAGDRLAVSVAHTPSNQLIHCYKTLHHDVTASVQQHTAQSIEARTTRFRQLNSELLQCVDNLHYHHIIWSLEANMARQKCLQVQQKLCHTLTHSQSGISDDDDDGDDGDGDQLYLPSFLLNNACAVSQQALQKSVSALISQMALQSPNNKQNVVDKDCAGDDDDDDDGVARQVSSSDISLLLKLVGAVTSEALAVRNHCQQRLNQFAESKPEKQLIQKLRQLDESEMAAVKAADQVLKESCCTGDQLSAEAGFTSCEWRQMTALNNSHRRQRHLVDETRTKRLAQQLNKQTDCLQQIDDTYTRVNQAVKNEQDQILVDLEEIRKQVLRVKNLCAGVRNDIHSWRDEPGQRYCDDITIDGANFQQWLRRFNSATALTNRP